MQPRGSRGPPSIYSHSQHLQDPSALRYFTNLKAIPQGVWLLGLVSLFMDLSSEMIHSLLPVFMVSVLGTSVLFVGLIEGIAEAAALIVKIFSGVLSDYLQKRKLLTVVGYGLSACTKPIFALATSINLVMLARFTDRVGKGIRGAPRDALLADITPADLRGAGYGLRQSLDTVGAFAGPLLAIALMALFADDIRTVFWFAMIPAFIAVFILIIGVREPPSARSCSNSISHQARTPIKLADLKQLTTGYWIAVLVGSTLTLARFSEAFLVLRAEHAGLALTWLPLVLIVMNTVYALVAYPAGYLSDRYNRYVVIGTGFFALIVADGILAASSNLGLVLVAVACWGLHMGLTQGVLSALIADTTPVLLRGSAFGLFNLISGIMLLFASLLAGWLWERYNAAAPFYAGSLIATSALLGLIWLAHYRRPHRTLR